MNAPRPAAPSGHRTVVGLADGDEAPGPHVAGHDAQGRDGIGHVLKHLMGVDDVERSGSTWGHSGQPRMSRRPIRLVSTVLPAPRISPLQNPTPQLVCMIASVNTNWCGAARWAAEVRLAASRNSR